MISFIPEDLENYVTEHSQKEEGLLKELRDFTLNNSPAPIMLSGHVVGRFLKFLVTITKSRNVLEIGTFTGYSALCLAEGLGESGSVTTLDKDPGAFRIAKKFFEKSPLGKRITAIQGPAIESLKSLDGPFDFIFIDADKVNYLNYYHEVLKKVQPGAVIVFDNCFLQGKILQANCEKSKVMHELNQTLRDDPRVENFILSVRDGLHVVRVL